MANTVSVENKNEAKPTNGQAWHVRPYREGDIPALVEFVNACAAVDSFDKTTSVEELTDNFNQPMSEPLKQVLIIDGPKQAGLEEGTVLAMARAVCLDDADAGQRLYQMRVRIHPAVREMGLDTFLSSHMLAHIRAYEASGEVPERDNVQLLAISREEDRLSRSIYEGMGLKPVRYAWTMERSLDVPISQPKEIEGVLIRSYNRPDDNEGARNAYNNSFIDHFEFHAMPPEIWEYIASRPEARPDLSWLAEIKEGDDAGGFAGFCICEINEKSNERTGHNEGWIGLLGTIRGWRGVGLGKSLLLRGLNSLKEAGMETALLGVDAESPTGANRLYESVGFTIRNFEILYKAPLADL